MNWIKQNPFVSGVAGVALVLILSLGYLLFSSWSFYSEQEEAYLSKVRELHKLQEESPYPSEENLKAIRVNVDEYLSALKQAESDFRKLLPPVPEKVTPQEFQDELRKVVSLVAAKAKENKVELPADFYLGFEKYRSGLPSNESAAPMARQLESIHWIFTKVLESGIAKVNSFTRAPLPIEDDKAYPGFPKNPKPEEILRVNRLNLSVSGDQIRVRKAVNELVACPQFLIIRAMDFQNSAPKGPPKVAGSDAGASASGSSGGLADLFGSSKGGKGVSDLPILLGRETVTCRMNLELLDFAPLNLDGAAADKTETPKKK